MKRVFGGMPLLCAAIVWFSTGDLEAKLPMASYLQRFGR